MEQDREIANAITHALTKIHSDYNQAHTAEIDDMADKGSMLYNMLSNPATRAEFAADGKITKRSTTQIITRKLKTARFKLLSLNCLSIALSTK